MIAENDKVKFVQCSICKTKVCFKCRERWHKGSCEANLEKVYQSSYGDKKNVWLCPMCKTRIERTGGCNHMTCSFCLFEFCWICGAAATEGSKHWDPMSLTGCGATWLDGKLTKRDRARLRTKKLNTFCCIFVCFPFIVLIYVPVFLWTIVMDATDEKRWNWSNWVRVPLAILAAVVIGIPLGVIAIPFALIYMVYLVVHECCYLRCCHKSSNQLAAEERIRSLSKGSQQAIPSKIGDKADEQVIGYSTVENEKKDIEDLESNM